ncbi:DUF4386 domain-containing protein [Dyadobacter sp. LHD-138]|uniref:DUF4386 domain-containing protein n=1 Tax=Dyadobacter sp. LHD-138 TaxID=3071413 RepID=UPI0027E16EA9|nr:DUF4386 domain-containing protein [Dyadobacter sp. LHD-138]MDQ6477961.1 DUF4386 domain-containing protein [Dyadobacter sp. LHD-138]
MNSNKNTARIAGLLYLVVVMTGIFNLAYVPGQLIVWEDAAATFNNISSSETLFRLGILSAVICYVFFLFLPLALYKLLSPVNKNHALAMVILAVVSVPISLVNLLNKYEILNLISRADYLKIFGTEQLQTQVLLHLHAYNNGNQIASIFWGLWLFPFGYLVFKSGFLPKILGILLMTGCFGYLIKFVGHFLLPGYDEMSISGFVTLPASIGEIGTCLWLLIMGAKDSRS